MRCPRCGGNNVHKDAVAEWDVEAQDWTLCGVHDHESCGDCDYSGDYMAERVELEEGAAA